MSAVKLNYFGDVKGFGELSRYIIKCGNLPVEDVRVDRDSFPTKVKPFTPLGQMPFLVLENGNQYGQSAAVARYLANQCGLGGKTEEEKLHADMVVELIKFDMVNNLMKAKFAEESKQAELYATAYEKCNEWMGKLEEKYVYGDGSFLASGLSWADLTFFNMVNDFFPVSGGFSLDETRFPKLQGIVAKVAKEPAMAAWLASRPVTAM